MDATQCDRCEEFFPGDPVLKIRIDNKAAIPQMSDAVTRLDKKGGGITRRHATKKTGEYCASCAMDILSVIPPMEGQR